MTEQLTQRLRAGFQGRVVERRDAGYRQATSIWPYADVEPLLVAQCVCTEDVAHTVRVAREADVPLSTRGGGHDWAGRSLCGGIVVDLTRMRDVSVGHADAVVRVGGGARGVDVLAQADRAGLAPVTGSIGAIGMAGLTLGGGYGPLIAHFGLACDNLLSAEVVLADGSLAVAADDGSSGSDPELLWALRGGGGNFGVVTSMTLRLHPVPRVLSGLVAYPIEQAADVFDAVSDLCAGAADALTVQVGIIPAPEGLSVAVVCPTWSGRPELGTRAVAPFLTLGKPLLSDVRARSYAESCAIFDPHVVDGRLSFMDTRWLPELRGEVNRVLAEQVRKRPSPLCSVLAHEFRGAACRVAPDATAFGVRRPHVMIEVLAQVAGGDRGRGEAERAWVADTIASLDAYALPGSYANISAGDDPERVRHGFGPNGARLRAAKNRYDPSNVFASAITLPKEA